MRASGVGQRERARAPRRPAGPPPARSGRRPRGRRRRRSRAAGSGPAGRAPCGRGSTPGRGRCPHGSTSRSPAGEVDRPRGSRPTRPGSRRGAGRRRGPRRRRTAGAPGAARPRRRPDVVPPPRRGTAARPSTSTPDGGQPGVQREAEAEGPGAVAEQAAAGDVAGEPVDGPGSSQVRQRHAEADSPERDQRGAESGPARPRARRRRRPAPSRSARPTQDRKVVREVGHDLGVPDAAQAEGGERRRQAALAVQGEHRGARCPWRDPACSSPATSHGALPATAHATRVRSAGAAPRGESSRVTSRVSADTRPAEALRLPTTTSSPGQRRHPAGTTGGAAGEDQPRQHAVADEHRSSARSRAAPR